MSLAPDPLSRVFVPVGIDRHALAGNLVATASMVAWAAGFPAAEALLERWPVLPLVAARFCMAVAVLVPLWALLEGSRAVRQAPWGRGTLLGALTFGLAAWALLAAQSVSDPVTVAIVCATTPALSTAIEMAHRERRMSRPFAWGLLLAIAGGLVTVGTMPTAAEGLGVALALVSSFLFALGSHQAVRSFPEMSPVGRTTVTLGGGMIAMLVIAGVAVAAGRAPAPAAQPTPADLAMLAIYGGVAMALSQILWIASVGRLGVALASFHINAAAFYVMAFFFLLGAPWNPRQALGAAIVMAGVIVAQRGPAAPALRTARPRA